MSAWLEKRLGKELDKRKEKGLLRELQSNESGSIDLSSNDYLQLSRHPKLLETAHNWAIKHGVGARASRLLSGSTADLLQLEKRFAALLHREAVLFFNTGYQMNSTVLPAIIKRDDHIFIDRLAHNSLYAGAVASRAHLHRFEHNSISDLRDKIQGVRSSGSAEPIRRFVITESVFSMDGDSPDWNALFECKQAFDVVLIVDDAHAFGLFGEQGFGMAAGFPQVDILLGTFAKAAGSSGAYLSARRTVVEALVNFCSGFIYTTGMSPLIAGAIEEAIALIPMLKNQRMELGKQAQRFRIELSRQGWNVGDVKLKTPIVNITIGEVETTLRLAHQLEKAEIRVSMIRPPTVPAGTSRLRLSLHSGLSSSDYDRIIESFALLKAQKYINN